jgi:hypothetical protein
VAALVVSRQKSNRDVSPQEVPMRVREFDLAGRRVLRAAAYTMAEDPEPRLLIWTAWQDDPPLPVSAHCVSFPASALPELVEALTVLKGGEK